MKIGDKIKQIRMNKKISQKDLAKQLDMPVSTLANYENNHREPNIKMLTKISRVLDVDIAKLLEEPNSEQNKKNNIEIAEINSSGYPFRLGKVQQLYKALQQNTTILPPVSFEEMKAEVDAVFPALNAEITFLSDPNIEKMFNYSFDELCKNGYQELLISAIEKAINDTLNDIKAHLEAGDLFDGVSSWINKESPLYEILKNNKNENNKENK
ncbi:helix-turn-helix domain-containing protein [Clostridium tetanomorphum DSM 665]|nr:helix-turn-helix domain-containing protein [Clostridium tetanomorphum DSM 665]